MTSSQTEMYWPLAHMVSRTEDAVTCVECHSSDGRLKDMPGPKLFIPGRDSHDLLDTIGLALIALTILGALAHGVLRIIFSGRA
jgi:hypothetical protein